MKLVIGSIAVSLLIFLVYPAHHGVAETSQPLNSQSQLQQTEPDPYPGLFIGNRKLMDMILARILSRKGLYEQALKVYSSLRTRYPNDQEIWEDYIETLVNFGDYELALAELTVLLRNYPSNLRAQRIQARIYIETGRIQWTFPVYETILRQYRDDIGIWSDYAHARLNAGDWDNALTYFGKILETDPDNTEAVGSSQIILREHVPRLNMQTLLRRFEGGNRIDTMSAHHSFHVDSDSRLILQTKHIFVKRLGSRESAIDDNGVVLEHFIDSNLMGIIGIGANSVDSGQVSLTGGVEYKFSDYLFFKLDLAMNRPWYDPVDAAHFDGVFDQYRGAVNWHIATQWSLYLEATAYEYELMNWGKFGREKNITAIVNRKLFDHPDLILSYALHRSWASYTGPFPIIESEQIHSLYFNLFDQPCTYGAWSLAFGYRTDTTRHTDAWFVYPGIRIRLGNRMELNASYEYLSESTQIGGGTTHTFSLDFQILF